MVGTKLGYNFTEDLSTDITNTFGEKTSHNGWERVIDFSFLFGKDSHL